MVYRWQKQDDQTRTYECSVTRVLRAALCIGILAWCAFVVYAPIWWGTKPPPTPMLTSLRPPEHQTPVVRPTPWPKLKRARP